MDAYPPPTLTQSELDALHDRFSNDVRVLAEKYQEHKGLVLFANLLPHGGKGLTSSAEAMCTCPGCIIALYVPILAHLNGALLEAIRRTGLDIGGQIGLTMQIHAMVAEGARAVIAGKVDGRTVIIDKRGDSEDRLDPDTTPPT